MAGERCNLDNNKEEAELLKPSSTSSSPPPPPPPSSSPPPPPPTPQPSTTPPPLFLTPPQEFSPSIPERPVSKAPVIAAADKVVSAVESDEPEPPVRSINRCCNCKKRVGLTGFRCRCGELFCGRHRYSDAHDCSFDYKAFGREEISRNNPVIRAAKILKI